MASSLSEFVFSNGLRDTSRVLPSSEERDLMVLDVKVLDKMYPSVENTPTSFLSGINDLIDDLEEERRDTNTRKQRKECTVFVFGETEKGRSCVYLIEGFYPSLTFVLKKKEGKEKCITSVLSHLGSKNVYIDYEWLNSRSERGVGKRLCGWEPDPEDARKTKVHDTLKLFFPTVRSWRAVVEECKSSGGIDGIEATGYKLEPELQFLDEKGIDSAGWMSVGCVSQRVERMTHCEMEYECHIKDVKPLSEKETIAPLLVASIDIETMGLKPEKDKINTIGVTFWREGTSPDSTVNIMLCVGECDPLDHGTVFTYNSERDLLDAWRDLMIISDPSWITGYNTMGFDYNFMCKRADLVGCKRFFYLSKFITKMCYHGERSMKSAQQGSNVMYVIESEGRVCHDVMKSIQADVSLRFDKYSLNYVSEKLLNENKLDVTKEEMFAAFLPGSTSMDRKKICDYCVQDCRLPVRLIHRQKIITNLVGMSRITHTLIMQLLLRGQQIKVLQQISWFARRKGFFVDTPLKGVTSDETFMGGMVCEPKRGFYPTPDQDPNQFVVVNDFQSLYPSIMRDKNLCFSTYVKDESYLNLEGAEYEEFELSGGRRPNFVQHIPGVLPLLLETLAKERKRVKKLMQIAETDELKAVYNGLQLAIKVSMNSVYGFSGAPTCPLWQLRPLAESVTLTGRGMIQKTIERANEYIPCEVLYGDTDSIMFQFKEAMDEETTFRKGEQVAEYVTKCFENRGKRTIILEMEKIYTKYLLIDKKKYAGICKEAIGDPGRMETKGVLSAKRGKCPFVRKLYQSQLHNILFHPPEVALKDLETSLSLLSDNKLPIEEYVQTAAINKDVDEFDAGRTLPSHMKAWKDQKEYDPGSETVLSDRIEYITIRGKEKKCERGVALQRVIKERLEPDRMHVFESFDNQYSSDIAPYIKGACEITEKHKIKIELQMEGKRGQNSLDCFGKGKGVTQKKLKVEKVQRVQGSILSFKTKH